MRSVLPQALIESVLEAVWLVDAVDLRIVAVNRAAEELLGLPRTDIVGRPVVDFAFTSQDLFFWEDVAAGRSRAIRSETLVKRGDGEIRHVERRVNLVQIEGGSACFLVALVDRSEQRSAEQQLENIIAELRATLESTADGILVLDMEGGIRGFNQRFAELWGIPEALLERRDDPAVFAWMREQMSDPEGYAERMSAIAHSPLLEAADTLVLRSGKVLERVTLPQFARGRPIGRVFSFRDITQRLADEARLKLAAQVFESSLDAIFVTDARFRMVAANPTFTRLTGWEAAEIEGSPAWSLLSGTVLGGELKTMRRALMRQGYWQGELWARRREGEPYPCLLSMVRVPAQARCEATYIGFAKDLSEAMAARRRIEELAFTDPLTGLPNRVLLRERFEMAINYARRDRAKFAVLFIDLDRFKQINDSLGHAFGDRVLVTVAERLKECVRQIDTAARLGGDEFMVLLANVDAAGAEIAARRILRAISEPIPVDDMRFQLTVSIGIAMYPEDGTDAEELTKNADSAMYAVKERGRADIRFYQRQMNIGLLSRVKLDHALRHALESGGLEVHFQPKFLLSSGEMIGGEALVRWNDSELGQVSPAKFIPVAEESGAIIPLGRFVLETTLTQLSRWWRAGLCVPLAVNVSALQFHQSDFVDSVAEGLRRHSLPGEALELELTESILIADVEDAMRRLTALSALGVRLAIDDFGTGYSSLSYLKRFPIERIKIDRSFIADLPGSAESEAIVVAIIQMGRALRLSVTAEGVETEAQRQLLLAAGCHEMQGWLMSPALNAIEFENRYGRKRSRPDGMA
ncbi:MAG: histidine kinase [Silanimonas sp.]|nr:MAG: histidine kinase [Silanimonas sp.]